MSEVTWVLEPNIFPHCDSAFRTAIQTQGHRLIEWSDTWWSDGVPACIPTRSVLFRGSLGNADRITRQLGWSPGAYCTTSKFHCSSWYESAQPWLIHSQWEFCTARDLVINAREIASRLGSPSRLFVRPDSPLKPFSGRVVDVPHLSLANLDYGFYFDDDALPVVVAPVRQIDTEWRFVVVDREVIAASAYDPITHKAISNTLTTPAAVVARQIASKLAPPETVYVLDLCESNGEVRLIELNPFGGADLYACDAARIVDQISRIASESP